jgi:hypothetical protein
MTEPVMKFAVYAEELVERGRFPSRRAAWRAIEQIEAVEGKKTHITVLEVDASEDE